MAARFLEQLHYVQEQDDFKGDPLKEMNAKTLLYGDKAGLFDLLLGPINLLIEAHHLALEQDIISVEGILLIGYYPVLRDKLILQRADKLLEHSRAFQIQLGNARCLNHAANRMDLLWIAGVRQRPPQNRDPIVYGSGLRVHLLVLLI